MSWRTRIFYAVGQMPEGIKTAAFGFFLLFYYNQVLGLSGTLAGIALFIALFFDAVSDPVVGSWSDFAKTRWGRRHPFMYWSALPFALCYFALFAPPDSLGQSGLFVWLLVFTVLTRVCMTFYHVPFMSLGAELTQNYDERTLLAALRNVFQLLGMFFVLIGGNFLFFADSAEFSNGQLNPEAYIPFALACIPLMLLGVWTAAACTHAEIPRLQQPVQTRGSNILLGAVADLRQAFSIRAFVAVVAASILFSVNQGMVQALHLYTASYFFELSGAQITGLFAGAITGIVIGSLLSRPMAVLVPEKRMLFLLGSAWYALWTSSIIVLRLLDVIPGNDHPWVAPAYIATGCISALGLGVGIPMITSMIADVTDAHELRYGTRQEGIYYAAASFASKAVGGIGPILAGFVIDLAGIVPGSTPGEVAPEAIVRFGWATGPSVLLLSGLSILCICFYSLSRQKHGEILTELRHRQTVPKSV
ncbi:MAG: MFS transporter [Pseudomonadota bacterium]